MDDRKLGYIILVLMGCTLTGIFGYASYAAFFPRQVRIIEFAQVGNILKEDPVCYHGMTIGTIRKLEGRGTKIYATVELFKPMNIYANYEIITLDKGLMGDRIITIDPGDSTRPIVPPGDTLHGMFFIGVSEVLGLVGKLEDGMRNIISLSNRLLSGTDSTPSLIEQFHAIVTTLDSLSMRLAAVTAAADRDIDGQLRLLNATLASTRLVSSTLAGTAPPLLEKLDGQVTELGEFAGKLKELVETLDTVVARLHSDDNLLWGDLAYDMSRKLRELRELVNQVEDGNATLKLRISRWKE